MSLLDKLIAKAACTRDSFSSSVTDEMSETDVKTDRPYTWHSKVSVTGCPLYTSAEISVLLWVGRERRAAYSLKYEREAKTFLKTEIKLFRYTTELEKIYTKTNFKKTVSIYKSSIEIYMKVYICIVYT